MVPRHLSAPRFSPPSARTAALFLAFLLLGTAPGWGLDFGQNKVRYHTDRHWKILETSHFDIFYYPPCETLSKKVSEMAENSFLRISKIFNYVPKTRIPVFIYATPLEFQETNVSPEMISDSEGGFTEVFKNRIVLPMDGSYAELQKVLTHEMTHAFQYDVIYGEDWRSINLFKSVFIPTWMMEGMAEWVSRHFDSEGEMVLRDGILNDQTLPLSDMDSFSHFEQVYMAYKESMSILEYVSQLYGADKVPTILKKMAQNESSSGAVKDALGITENELYDHWHFYVQTQAWSRIKGMSMPGQFGSEMGDDVSKAVVSPDGKQLASFHENDLQVTDITGNLDNGNKRTILNDRFQEKGAGIAWAPTGDRIAFCRVRDGENRLCVYDLKKNEVRTFHTPGLPMVYSPSWSPDGRAIVFAGFDDTSVNLYRLDTATEAVEKLTNDMDTKTFPTYSPDGKYLFYINESGGQDVVLKAALNEVGLPASAPQTLVQDSGTITSIQIVGNDLYFTSDLCHRIFNLYKMDLATGATVQLTDSFADILYASNTPDETHCYAIVYQKAKEHLYDLADRNFKALTAQPDLAYIENSFGTAPAIAATPGPGTASPTPLPPVPSQATTSAAVAPASPDNDKSQPFAAPALTVDEATNLVVLKWKTDDPDEVQAPGGTYHIYKASASSGPYTCVANESVTEKPFYADYDVAPAGTYYYYMTVSNGPATSASVTVSATPRLNTTTKDYTLTLTPDIMLFLAGYDSSFGFVGGGVFQMSDYLGDHRLAFSGITIPQVSNGVETDYEFSQWRTTVDLDFYYYQNYLWLYNLQTENIEDQYRNNENGLDLNFSYPFDQYTRIEYGVGTQRFQGTPLYLQFSEGISNYSQNSTQWNIANYYRLSFVQDKREGMQFWPSSGYCFNLTLVHALPVLDYNNSFANVLVETQTYADLSFLNHMVWANRWIGMTSQGPNPQTFFIAEDVPFEAYFTAIRGYGTSTFYGHNLLLWNTELRYPAATGLDFALSPLDFISIQDIELAAFMDMGTVNDQWQELNYQPLRCSIGAGVRLYTFLYQQALVMLRFDVAWQAGDLNQAPTFYFNLAPMF